MSLWSEEEIKFLKENYDKMVYREIGKVLGRSSRAVGMKAWNLKLKPPKRRKYDGKGYCSLCEDYYVLEKVGIRCPKHYILLRRGPRAKKFKRKKQVVTDEDINMLAEKAIQRKKKGVRYSGKHKGRGKEKRRLP